MIDLKKVIKRRMTLFIANLVLCFILTINYLNSTLLPVFMEYGQMQSANVLTRIFNIVVKEQLSDELKDKAVVQNYEDTMLIDFNVNILNSVAHNVVNRSQQILYDLENGKLSDKLALQMNLTVDKEILEKGVVYEVPISMALKNSLIGNLGLHIPIKYSLVGKISGEVVSTVKEYGINNVLLEIDLKIAAKTKVLIPMMTKEEEVLLNVPLIVKVIQGKVPDYYLGTQLIGGVG